MTNTQSSGSPLLVVGSVALDTVETSRGRRDEILGGAACYSSYAASFFTPTRLVGVVGTDFPSAHEEFLRAQGIDTAGLERAAGRTFRWSGRYAPDFNTRTTLDTQLNVLESFKPKLPSGWSDSPYVFLANIDPALQLDVLLQVKNRKFSACDTMDFWISGRRKDLLAVLERVDLLLLNDEEARQLSGATSVPAAAKTILGMGPKAVVVKRGDAGALLFQGDEVFVAPAFPLDNVLDPTGAGDSFAGGCMGYIARTGDTSPKGLRSALVAGTVLASFCVEDFSLDRFRTLDVTSIRERTARFADLVAFQPPRI